MRLASALRSQGKYAEAIGPCRKAMEIWAELLGRDHPDYAQSLNTLAWLYQAMGDYARAEPMYREALAIRKKALGVDHPDYAISLNNLAQLYRDMGDYARAEPMFHEALAITKKALGVDHPDYAMSLNNLATAVPRHGRQRPPRADAPRGTGDQEEGVGRGPPRLRRFPQLPGRAVPYHGRLRPRRALIVEALKISSNLSRGTSAILGERQRLRMYQSQRGALDAYLSMSRATGAKPADLYRHVLDWKGAAEARQVEDRLARDQPELRPSLAKLAQVRGQLVNLAFRPPPVGQAEAWRQQFDKLREAKEDLEADLAHRSARLSRSKASGTAGARRGGRGPPRRGGPGRHPRIHPLQPTPGWQRAAS